MQADQLICNGKYKLIGLIGEGGFGEVWLAAENASRDYQVAIKFAHKDKQEAAQRFAREIFLSRRLDHPHLLRADTVDHEGDTPCLVFAYMQGGSLADKLKSGALPIPDAVQIAISVADALAYLHDRDIVHRDVHPGNILFAKEGKVKLCDLGVAQSKDFSTSLWYGDKLDRHPGNIYYQPPEAVGKVGESLKPLYPAADVFMLGSVLWEMLTGKGYFSRKGQTPKSLRPDVPRWLDEYVMQMLAPDANHRPHDGEVVMKSLREKWQGHLGQVKREEKARQDYEKRKFDQEKKQHKQREIEERGRKKREERRRELLASFWVSLKKLTPVVVVLTILGVVAFSVSAQIQNANASVTRMAIAFASLPTATLTSTITPTNTFMPTGTATLTSLPTSTSTIARTATSTNLPIQTATRSTSTPTISRTSPAQTLTSQKLTVYNNNGIYLRSPDGSTRLLVDEPGAQHALISPDGSKVVFSIWRPEGTSIFIVDIAGANLKRLTQAWDDYPSSWSPDGKQILFSSLRDPESVANADRQLYLMNSDGSNPIRLTPLGSQNFFVSWVVSENRIYFISTRLSKYSLYSMRPDGSDQRYMKDCPAVHLPCTP